MGGLELGKSGYNWCTWTSREESNNGRRVVIPFLKEVYVWVIHSSCTT